MRCCTGWRSRRRRPGPAAASDRGRRGLLTALTGGACLGLLAFAGGCASGRMGGGATVRDLGAAAEPLRQLDLRHGRLAWDGLVLGMTFHQIEATVGRRLDPPALDPEAVLDCARPTLRVELLGSRLELEFSGTFETSRLVAATLLLAGPDAVGDERGERGGAGRPALDSQALRAAVRARLDGLEFVPSPHAPEVGEAAAEKALYRAPGGGSVFVDPARGVYFGEVCVD